MLSVIIILQSLKNEANEDLILKIIKSKLKNSVILIVENKGMDIGPFLN